MATDPAGDLLGPECSAGRRLPGAVGPIAQACRAGRGLRPERRGAHAGVFNSAFYEHALLARLMGVHLVEGRDLTCHGVDVYLQTTDGEMPVHVIYRRVDDEYLDPLHFRPDSLVGCPGLVNAARAGRVTVANAIGNGIADDKLLYAYVPEMIRYYLDEDPILRNIETYRLVDDEERERALKRRDELVFKRVDGSGGKDMLIGPYATTAELDRMDAGGES